MPGAISSRRPWSRSRVSWSVTPGACAGMEGQAGRWAPPPCWRPPALQCILEKEPNFLASLFRQKIILVIMELR